MMNAARSVSIRVAAVAMALGLAACGGASTALPASSATAATVSPTAAASTPSPVVTSAPPASPTIYIDPGFTLRPGTTPPATDLARATLVSAGDNKTIQLKVVKATFLPVGQTLAFMITADTKVMSRKPNATRVSTLADAGIKVGDTVLLVYETVKNADGTYHLLTIYLDE